MSSCEKSWRIPPLPIARIIFTLLALEVGLRVHDAEWGYANFRFPRNPENPGRKGEPGLTRASKLFLPGNCVAHKEEQDPELCVDYEAMCEPD
jgi:hypothetical protein